MAEEKKKIKIVGKRTIKSSKIERSFFCADCGYKRPSLEPREFSFNSGHGACPTCSGLGVCLEIDPELIFNNNLSILEGAIKSLSHSNLNGNGLLTDLENLATRHNFSLREAIKDLPLNIKNLLLKGDEKFPGIIKYLENKYQETKSNFVKQEIEKTMHNALCPLCFGARLKPESLAVKINGLNIFEITQLSIEKPKNYLLIGQKQ